MNIFFCDIRGTFDGSDNTREIELQKFVDNLKRIMEINNIEKLFFSFVTADNMEYVIECMKELEMYLEKDKIVFGPQFSEDKVLINGKIKESDIGKIYQMINYIKKNNIQCVYYADDSKIYHMMFNSLLQKNYPYIKRQSFLFENNKKGIKSLNTCLKEYIEKNKKQKNKTLK